MRSPRRKAPSVPASLQRSASASNRRFSLPENWRRLAIATTSGSRRAASSEAVSPVALRASSATASEEEPNDPFIEDFSNELMCMSYLYSKLPETGVSPHIGTGGFYHVKPSERCRLWHFFAVRSIASHGSYWGQSGPTADIAKLTRLTRSCLPGGCQACTLVEIFCTEKSIPKISNDAKIVCFSAVVMQRMSTLSPIQIRIVS